MLDTLRFGPPASPESLAERWARTDLRGLHRLIEFEGCSTWAYRRLRQLAVLPDLDSEFTKWLSDRARDETARNLLIDAEAEALATVFRRLELPAVLMKGAARRLVADRYPFADARQTNDLDVLVPAQRAWELWHELRRQGYERTKLTKPPRTEHHHLPALWNERRVGVEIHTTHSRAIAPDVSWRRHEAGSIAVVRAGTVYRVPSATELFWSATAHALLIPHLAFFLIRLLDAANVWASGAPIDWAEVARRMNAKEIIDGRAAAAWLGAAADLAGAQPPPAMAGRIERYDLGYELRLRFAVLRRVDPPPIGRKALAWWTSERARSRF